MNMFHIFGVIKLNLTFNVSLKFDHDMEAAILDLVITLQCHIYEQSIFALD